MNSCTFPIVQAGDESVAVAPVSSEIVAGANIHSYIRVGLVD